MTGFGRAARETAHGRLVVEVRTVNARFSEPRIRLPGDAIDLEIQLRDQIKAAVARGKADCTVTLEPLADAATPVVNAEALRETFRQLHEAVAGLPLSEGITLEALLRATPREDNAAELWRDEEFQAELIKTMAEALDALQAARADEGAKISAVLGEQLDQIESAAGQVRDASGQVAEGLMKRLRERLEELERSQGVSADPGRLEQELVYFTQRCDVAEELDRLAAHCTAFRELLSSGEPVGRRMDFLLQEIGREINTVGSKARDVGITGLVVDLKVVAEQMREQVQNVE
jgi:uncharacterized protein (TIGR00255 family)